MRPTKLTQAVEDAFCAAVRMGAPFKAAAEAAGISVDAIAEWIERGEGRHPTRKPTADFVRFAGSVRKAVAQSELLLLARVQEAAKKPKEWRAAAWLLKVRFPETYGDRVDTTVTFDRGRVTAAVARIAAALDEAEAEAQRENGEPEGT